MPSPERTSRTSPRFASWCTRFVLLSSLVSCQKSSNAKTKACVEALADGKHTEARAWLSDPATAGFEVSKDWMRDIVETFYAAGSPRVTSAWNEHDGKQISALLVVELPSDSAARTRIIAKHNNIAPLLGLERESDAGQTCLLVSFE